MCAAICRTLDTVRGPANRIAPRWVRSAPRSRSTSRASEAFEALADLARRPPFTDHFLSGFHLTRIESAGRRRRRPLPASAAPLRTVWMDTTIVELDAPFRIVEHGRGGRANRIPTTTRSGS